ncbi:putative signal transduction protein with Nacht domain protein [Candidatus Vecturithrix granuli]|uniref:Putative signal transduction protein with Nacht domain protein n=1 Tax=Vecturithrix granuli TaxID=1499967 RepID=A0A081C631_VECG1|nr:putative signal transduction protein with Nacht domain protein [Candidatus Vecturithrix granuli]
MKLPGTLRNKIIDFLQSLPNIGDIRGRQAFIYSVGLDSKLQDQIVFDEPPAQFIPLLVKRLLDYGQISDKRNALEAVLKVAKNYVGLDRKAYCDELLAELSDKVCEFEAANDALICNTSFFKQLLVNIPLSALRDIVSFKMVLTFIDNKERIEQLENNFFIVFSKVLNKYIGQYNVLATLELRDLKREDIQTIIKTKSYTFYESLKKFRCEDISSDLFSEEEIQRVFIETFVNVFKDDLKKEQYELIEAIYRDTVIYYRETFFEEFSKNKQIWNTFKTDFKIDTVLEFLHSLYHNISIRNHFENLRFYSIRQEIIPQKINELEFNYLHYIERKFASIELKGVSPRVHGQDISFDLDEIFIPLKIGNNEKTKHFLLSYEDKNKYTQLFQKEEPLQTEKSELLAYLERLPCIVLLGDPGGGKSTLLKYIARQVSKLRHTNKFLPFYVPIFLRISEYAQAIKSDSSKRLLDFLYHDYDKQYSELFKWAFENYRALLLLDGLDEVLDTFQRMKIVEEVEDIVARMPENRYIITSRVVGYNEARFGKSFIHFTIEKFDRARIKAFCESWYKAVAKNSFQTITTAINEANKLYEAIIEKPEIESLACNPLLITLIANIHFKGQTLPYNRVQLYDIATETLLQYWVQHRVNDDSQLKDKDDVLEILSPVAFYIHQNSPDGTIEEQDFHNRCKQVLNSEAYNLEENEIKKEIKEFTRFLRQQSGFFHEKGIDDETGRIFFGFFHQTFQEYLAAIEIVNQWKEESLDLSEIVFNPRWSESLQLSAGILKCEKGRSGKQSVTRFVKDILKLENIDHRNTSYHQPLFLVASILADNIDLIPQTQEEYFDFFFEKWTLTSDNKILDEFDKHFSRLLRSKNKETIWKRMESILKEPKHPLQTRFPKIIASTQYLIKEAKNYYIQFLNYNDITVIKVFWEYLQELAVGASQTMYYEAQNYGDPSYIPYDPSVGLMMINYSELLKAIEDLPIDFFLNLINTVGNIWKEYEYIYNAFWTGYWYCSVDIENMIPGLTTLKSARLRILMLYLISQENKLLEYKDRIWKALQEVESKDELFDDFEKRLRAKVIDVEKSKSDTCST